MIAGAPSRQIGTPQRDSLDERLGIVIVTHNRRERLATTLDRLQALAAGYPIAVVDNASSDGTAGALLGRMPPVHVIRLPWNVGAVGRNYGVQQLEREYIAFADDDSWWAPDSLSQAVELFDRYPRLGLIMSRVLAGAEQALDPCCELMSRSPLPARDDLPGIPVLGFLACGAIVRRDAFLDVGGFDERFGSGGEENFVAVNLARSGWGVAYMPEIVSYHRPSPERDLNARSSQGTSARIWEAWMQRGLWRATSITLQQARKSLSDPVVRSGFWRALRGMPATLRRRDPVPPELEAQIRLLERQRGEG